MSKVMIVEDDESLREIYGIRLTAEGYAVISAHDGEEALAVAVKERPDLIISDVMMPKISGFDMLDILRSTPETQNIKVIMMTALSSDDQRVRGENLGADRYLVKSQVGIEDVVNVVHEVLGDRDANGVITTAIEMAPAQAAPVAPGIPMQATPAAAAPQASVAPNVAPTPMPAPAPIATSVTQVAQNPAVAPNAPITAVPQAPVAPGVSVQNVPPQVMPPAQ